MLLGGTPQAFQPFDNSHSKGEDECVSQQLYALGANGCTGGFLAPQLTETQVHGLQPINIDPRLELYLGIRNSKTLRYEGDRLYYDGESYSFAPCRPETDHHPN